MRVTMRSTLAVGALCLLMVGCADRMAELQSYVEEANAELEAAYQEGDSGRLAALFTDDALIMPNGGRNIPGRTAVENLFVRIFRVNTVLKYELVVEELEVFGNTAYERGAFDYQAVGASQDTTADQGRYIMIRKRDADGAWLIHRWMENTSPADQHSPM